MSSLETNDGSGDERTSAFNLGDVVAAIRQRVKLILLSTVIVTAAAAAFVATLPNRYEGVASVQIDQRHKEIANVKNVISDLKADAATVDSEVEVMKSRQILSRVIDQLALRGDAEFTATSSVQRMAVWLGWSKPPFRQIDRGQPASIGDLITSAGEPERDEIARAVEQRLKVSRVRNTLLLEIRFWSADPVKAARIANAIADTYLKMQIELKTRAMQDASGRLQETLVGLREKVVEAERAIERFKSEHDIFDADGHLLVDRQLAREMEALVISRNKTGTAKARFEQARRMIVDGEGNEAVADVLQSNTVRLLRDELTKALRRQAEAQTKYGPKHPEMQKIAADVGKAQSELVAETSKIIKNLKSEYEVANAGERQQSTRLDALKDQIASNRETQWRLRELEREALASKQLYESLLARNKQTVETQGLQFADARLVEAADVPLYPVAPKRKQLVAMAAAVGLVLGLALALLLELGGGGFARPADVERILALPHLGSVPRLQADTANGTDALKAIRLIIAEPQGSFAEAIRSIKYEIECRGRRNVQSVILVASSLPNEGRTVIASNLALQYASSGRRTLLIDADMRRAELSHQLGLDGAPGLGDLLATPSDISTAIVCDRASGLFVLPASSNPDFGIDAPELLESQRCTQLLDYLRSQYEIIIFDAPPLLPVIDARIIADQADSIVFVTAWRRTPREIGKNALKLLGSNVEKVVGVVVNQVSPGAMPRSSGMGSGTYAATTSRQPTSARQAA